MAERKRGDLSGLSQDYQRYRPGYPAEITAAGVALLKAGGLACDSRLLAVQVIVHPAQYKDGEAQYPFAQ